MREHYIPFRVRESTKKKKKPLAKGDLIVSSEPFAHVINNNRISSYCDYCFLSGQKKILKPCKGCRLSWYCSDDCARLGKDFHEFECLRLQSMAPDVPSPIVRLLARIIVKLRNGGDKVVEKFNEKDGRKFRDLMNHYADVKNNKASKKDVDSLIPTLAKYIGKNNLPNYSDVLGIYGRVLVNRFCIFDETLQTFGSGVFLGASIFDHACIPNCYPTFVGRKVHIRSLVDMPEINYDKFRISYIDPVMSMTARRQDLHNKWYFWCDCKTCQDKERGTLESSILCENCSNYVYIPDFYTLRIPSIECERCQQPIEKEKIKLYQQTIIFTKFHLNRMNEDGPKLPDCLEILEKHGDMLHPMNVWRVRTLDFAFNAAIHGGCWGLALTYGEKNFEGMKYYYGETHPTFALFLFKYGKAKIYLKEFREGVKLLEQAEPILRQAMGSTHPVIVDQLIPTNLLANEDVEICLERRLAATKKRELIQAEKEIKKMIKPISKYA